MKTIKFMTVVLFSLVMMGTSAQVQLVGSAEEFDGRIEDSVKLFRQLSSDIAFNENFIYRKELKESQTEFIRFYFKDTTLSKVKVLKHFKRAARRSNNSIQFKNYFVDKQLHFIQNLDAKTLTGVYDAMRSKTLNGYLDILTVFALSDRMMYMQEGS